MEESQDLNVNSKYLLEQLLTARKEIHNLRQQVKSLRYVHERDVESIKKLLLPHTAAACDASNTFTRSNEPSTSNSVVDDSLNCQPIGVISSWFPNKKGTPRQATVCGKAPGKITLFKSILTNPHHALEGLEAFSHMWILFHFHKNELGHTRAKVAPPRLNGSKTGVFSTRSPHRPCPIGLSLVKIVKIEDNIVYFEGVDMIDQTPVLDIKPYIPHYDNPAYIGQMLNAVTGNEEVKNDDSSASFVDNPSTWANLGKNNDSAASFADNTNTWINLGKKRNIKHSTKDYKSPIQIPSSSSSSTSSLTDVLKDEELALRLQAEEFQENFHFQEIHVNSENTSILRDNQLSSIVTNTNNLDSISYESANLQINDNDERSHTHSRFLDGADGPNTICGTDLDSINRRTLNLRLDDSSSSSSPVRMGIREAPDGEEGFDSSQPINIQQQTASSNEPENVSTSGDFVDRLTNENVPRDNNVRIPNWISKPKTPTLSVIFNERSVQQLHEILNDKANEKRQAVENVLKEDPRSVYLRQRYGNQFYTFLIHDLHITCRFDDEKRVVTVLQIRQAGRMCACGQPEWQCSGHSPLSTFN